MMDPNNNPFGPPPPQQMNAIPGGNPFGPLGGGAPQPPQQDPRAAPPVQQAKDSESVAGYSTHSSASNPFGAPPPAQSTPFGAPPPQHQHPYGASQQEQPPQTISYGNYPFSSQPSYPYGVPAQQHGAMVIAPNQSNPYAMAAPQYGQQQQQQQQQQQLVAAPQQSQPWAVPAAARFDPFARPPPPAPAPASETMNQEIVQFFQPQLQVEPYHQPQQEIEPFSFEQSDDPPGVPASGPPQDPPPRNHSEDFGSPPEIKEAPPEIKEAPDVVASPEGTTYPPQIQYGHRPDVQPDREPSHLESPRNPYAPLLAREAPPGASPLPKAELVRKRGFVLARISFRTIVMKKWKQSYWVQYGPHTMLWFRSQADFDDWLNNPYLMQPERNFLIKLAVNFVHDLYKPNVRGYQVTQCRTKGYGNKLVRQFKLERWMDYGPTIAAAFGSYDPAEVDALREAVVECMRNTPLNGGIRATGAVRQPNPTPQQREREEGEEEEVNGMGRRSSSYDELPKDDNAESEPPQQAESVSEEADLLDVNNWDDVPVEPKHGPISQSQAPSPYIAPPQPSQYGQAPYGSPEQTAPLQHQQPYGQANPFATAPQQLSYSTAMVPTGPQLAYPGAPPPPQQQQWAPQQQQSYPVQQHQQSYPPQQQQQQAAPQQSYPPAPQQSYPPASQDPWAAPQPKTAPQQAQDPWAAPQPQTYLPPPQY